LAASRAAMAHQPVRIHTEALGRLSQIGVGRRFAVAHDRRLHRRVAALTLGREQGARLDHAVRSEDRDVFENDTNIGILPGKRHQLGPHLPAIGAARIVKFDNRDAGLGVADFRVFRITRQSLPLRGDRIALSLRLRCLVLRLERADGFTQNGGVLHQFLPDQRDDLRALSRRESRPSGRWHALLSETGRRGDNEASGQSPGGGDRSEHHGVKLHARDQQRAATTASEPCGCRAY
jgi:hypothetical protein